jgi:hypothetical protein
VAKHSPVKGDDHTIVPSVQLLDEHGAAGAAATEVTAGAPVRSKEIVRPPLMTEACSAAFLPSHFT